MILNLFVAVVLEGFDDSSVGDSEAILERSALLYRLHFFPLTACSAMATRAAGVLSSVRERVRKHISVPTSDAEALKICFLCSAVESDALLELSHDRVVRSQAIANCAALALSPEEFDALLCDATLTAPKRTALAAVLAKEEGNDECKAQHAAIAAALRLTLTEQAQQKRWQESARVRARVSLAMLRREDHMECLESALGGVLRSDHRLIDDLRAQTEEEGIDLIAVSGLIGAVCEALAS